MPRAIGFDHLLEGPDLLGQRRRQAGERLGEKTQGFGEILLRPVGDE
jgi:hypothetical protein